MIGFGGVNVNEAALGVVKEWGAVGALVSQKWDVEGGDRKADVFGGQLWVYLARPDAFGSGWVFRLTLTPVVPELW